MDKKLIELIKKHDIIWNTRIESYNDADQKEIVWQRISETLAVGVNLCKKRWRSLRDQFRKHKKLRDLNCVRAWKYYDQLKFLADVKGRPSLLGTNNKDDCVVNEIELIKQIQKYPALYDLDCTDNKMFEIKEKIWHDIGQYLEVDRELCKKRWKSLKDTYKKTKERTGPLYRVWKYADHMEFLDNVRSYVKMVDCRPVQEYNETEAQLDYSKPLLSSQLIIEVRKHEIIFDSSLADYGDTNKTAAAWYEIARNLKHSVKSCQERWYGLYDIYRKYRNKQSINALEMDDKPNWKFANHLRFLDDFQDCQLLNATEDFIEYENDAVPANTSQNVMFPIEGLIEEIRKYDIIYNTNLNDFTNSEKKNRIWQHISQALNCDDAQYCKDVWENIYNSYYKLSSGHQNQLDDTNNDEWLSIAKEYHLQLEFLDNFGNKQVFMNTSNYSCNSTMDLDHIKLINEVKKRQILYDISLPENRVTGKKDIEWERVSDAINIDVKTCKQRWKVLRDCYKKYKNSEHLKKTKWKYAEYLSFLDKSECFRRSSCTITDKSKIVNGDGHIISQTKFNQNLIKEVEKYEILYNIPPENAVNKQMKQNNAWLSISKVLNVNADICKRRWNRLRETYISYRQQDNKLEHKWIYADRMKFLDNINASEQRLFNFLPSEIVEFIDMTQLSDCTSSTHMPSSDNCMNVFENEIIQTFDYQEDVIEQLNNDYHETVAAESNASPSIVIAEEMTQENISSIAASDCQSIKTSTDLLLEYMDTLIQNSIITQEQRNELEASVSAVVYSKLENFKNS